MELVLHSNGVKGNILIYLLEVEREMLMLEQSETQIKGLSSSKTSFLK